MKEKTIAMAAAFTMLMAIGVTGIGAESLHRSAAYRTPQAQVQLMRAQRQAQLPATQTMLLDAPAERI